MAWHAILQHGEKIIFKVKCVKKRTLKEINKKKSSTYKTTMYLYLSNFDRLSILFCILKSIFVVE